MLVSDVFQMLSYGELSNISLSGEGSGTIIDAKKPMMLQHVNTALLRLYSRFVLLEKTVIIEQSALIRDYQLSSVYAESNIGHVDGQFQYIKDTLSDPFTDDVIKVLVAYDQYGTELPLNDPEDPLSIFTPRQNVVQVPNPVSGIMFALSYQAKHPKLVAYTDKVELPDTLTQALTAYIAYLVYSGISGDSANAKSQEHLSIYEALCGEISSMDLVSSSSSNTNVRFCKGGWV